MSNEPTPEVDKFGEKRFITYEKFKYCCTYCGNGADNPNEVFSKGACGSCGGPAQVVEKISTIEQINDAEKKVLFVNGSDTAQAVNTVKAQVEALGFETIMFSDLVPNGASRDQKYQLVGQASQACGMVFIFPSKQLDMKDGRLANEAYHEANDYMPEGQIKAIPILVDRSSATHLPHDARGLSCLAMSDQAKQGVADTGSRIFTLGIDKLAPTMQMFKNRIS